jgi:antitoxin component YwqK of YwqJK toxin-antitoxin module
MKSIIKKINRVDSRGREQGYWEKYHTNGVLHYKGSYKNGLLVGMWEFYWPSGNLGAKGSYVNGLSEGIWEYYQDGVLMNRKLWDNGVLIKVL